MNFEQARFNMVEQQVRTWDVLDSRVLDVMRDTPRERFVPESCRGLAYADVELPIGAGQTTLPPRIDARALQALEVGPSDTVLEVGTGSGVLTSMLCRLARHVTSVEIEPGLQRQAEQRLAELGQRNVTFVSGDGLAGHADAAPYDAIAVTGAVVTVPDALLRQLKPGGRLFVVAGRAPVMEALLITRSGEAQWARESLFETVVPHLAGAEEPEPFVL